MAVGGDTRWYASPGLIFHYTGAEQACVVPHYSEMRIIAVGGRGGNGWPDCGLSLNLGGAGGYGAQVDATRVSVHPGEVLYIEVGGDGGNGTHNCQIGGGAAGAAGWNGGAPGGLGSGMVGSGGGGGATDVRTVSCATVCDQGLGFGTFISLASRGRLGPDLGHDGDPRRGRRRGHRQRRRRRRRFRSRVRAAWRSAAVHERRRRPARHRWRRRSRPIRLLQHPAVPARLWWRWRRRWRVGRRRRRRGDISLGNTIGGGGGGGGSSLGPADSYFSISYGEPMLQIASAG